MTNKCSFDDVMIACGIERNNQDKKYGPVPARELSIGDYILIMEGELNEAKEGLIKQRGDGHSALEEIVQVAATAIACLQKHGLKGN